VFRAKQLSISNSDSDFDSDSDSDSDAFLTSILDDGCQNNRLKRENEEGEWMSRRLVMGKNEQVDSQIGTCEMCLFLREGCLLH
jgi:hypothetical protein